MRKHKSNVQDVVIIGAGYAGMMTALRLAGKIKNGQVRLTLINANPYFVERIRLHQLAANQPLPRWEINQFLAGTAVQFVCGQVTAIDPAQQVVTYQSEPGQQRLSYDKLVYALGSTVEVERVPGVADHAFTLGTQQTATHLRHQLPQLADRQGRVVVVGGGLTGIEAATEIAEAYPSLQVRLVTRGPLGAELSAKGARYLRQVLADLNIAVIDEVTVSQVTTSQIEGQDGQVIGHDLCLWAGAFAVPRLAQDSGILTDQIGRIVVDETLRSGSHPNIYAVGDAAATALRMGCATAMPLGCYAADHLAGEIQGRAMRQPFQFGYAIRCISLGRRAALIQFVYPDDRPKEKIITGRTAVWIKEMICRFTIWAIRVERRIPGTYWWPKAPLTQTSRAQAAVKLLRSGS